MFDYFLIKPLPDQDYVYYWKQLWLKVLSFYSWFVNIARENMFYFIVSSKKETLFKALRVKNLNLLRSEPDLFFIQIGLVKEYQLNRIFIPSSIHKWKGVSFKVECYVCLIKMFEGTSRRNFAKLMSQQTWNKKGKKDVMIQKRTVPDAT